VQKNRARCFHRARPGQLLRAFDQPPLEDDIGAVEAAGGIIAVEEAGGAIAVEAGGGVIAGAVEAVAGAATVAGAAAPFSF
jgi:hypothetical protein